MALTQIPPSMLGSQNAAGGPLVLDGSGLAPIANLPVGTTANKVVQLTAAGKLPAVDGSLLTGLSTGAMTVNSQSVAYTTVLADANQMILHPAADTTARTWSVPANATLAYPVGTTLMFVNQNGAGTLTLSFGDTVRLVTTGATGNRTLAANGLATAVKITTTEWLINGAGLT